MHAPEPIHEVTRAAIDELLTNYPKKKPAFKEYMRLNLIETMDDFTEDLALDILEQLDNVYYVRAIRRKREVEAQSYHNRLVETMENYFEDNKEDYVILDKVVDAYLISKRINIVVQYKNDKNTFNPYERLDDKEYFIIVLVKISDQFQPSELMQKFMTRGIRMIKCLDMYGVERSIKGII